jgi:hypothetical protein
MRELLLSLLISISAGLCFPPLSKAQNSGFDYAPYARILGRTVSANGYVHYDRLKTDHADLDAFVEQIAQFSPENNPELFPGTEHQLAYWINAYNALVLKRVVDRYPVGSIRDISFLFGFFWRLKHPVGEESYTLNHIEHDIIRGRFREPRIHFAINCASASCPKLATEPYLPERLDAQLEEAAKFFINEERNVRPEPGEQRIHLSKIFDWYEDDFEDHMRNQGLRDPSVLDYIKLYGDPELNRYIETQQPRIRHMDYDWSLNDAGKSE